MAIWFPIIKNAIEKIIVTKYFNYAHFPFTCIYYNNGGVALTLKSITTDQIHIPLKKPFVTAVRTTNRLDAVRVAIQTSENLTGYGEAPATPLITGETMTSIQHAITKYIAPAIANRNIHDNIPTIIQSAIYGNNSAKAAVEMAWYDLLAQKLKVPLHALIGNAGKQELTNNLTISINSTDKMIYDACTAISQGFSILKIKSGLNPKSDLKQLLDLWKGIKEEVDVPNAIRLRIDANQGWTPTQATRIIYELENSNLPIDLIEQPVPAWDIDGLAHVQSHTTLPVAADEAVFSPQDAIKIIQKRAAHVINIKLMKTGGIKNALNICTLCHIYGVECMIGCMMEGYIGAAAAAHLAASQYVVSRVDIDSPLLLNYSEGVYTNGIEFCDSTIKIGGTV